MQDSEASLLAFNRLAETYGPVFRISVLGARPLVVPDATMMKEVLDEKRFIEIAIPGLSEGKRPNGLIVAGTWIPTGSRAIESSDPPSVL